MTPDEKIKQAAEGNARAFAAVYDALCIHAPVLSTDDMIRVATELVAASIRRGGDWTI